MTIGGRDIGDVVREVQMFGPVSQDVIDHLSTGIMFLREERARHQKVRRRLVVKLLKEREERLILLSGHPIPKPGWREILIKNADWCARISGRIEAHK